MKWIFLLVLLAFANVLHASEPSESIDDFITSEMPASGAPGLAYAVLEGGEIYSGERGELLLGSGREIRLDTPFVIGSISKSFTALAVIQLVEAGKLDLSRRSYRRFERTGLRCIYRNGNTQTHWYET